MEFLVLFGYFLSYSALFLNIGLTVVFYQRCRDRSLLLILPWLLSSVAYLLFHNSAFLANAILKMPVDENSWSYLAVMVPLYCVQTFTEILFIVTATNPRFLGWLPKALLAASLAPLAVLPYEGLRVALGLHEAGSYLAEKTLVTYGTSLVLVVAILAYLVPNLRRARSDFHRGAYRSILVIFCIFQPVYMLQLFWNFQLTTSFRPLTSENVYYFAMNVWLAILLARHFWPANLAVATAPAPAEKPAQPVAQDPIAVPDLFGVTEREKEVILLLRQGLNNAQIAARLGISAVTVKNHIHNIYQKTGSRNRIEILNCFFPPNPGPVVAQHPRHAEKIKLN